MNWKIFMCTTKHKVSPAYSPTVAHECKAYQCTVGRMQGIRMICIRSMKWAVEHVRERWAIYRQRQSLIQRLTSLIQRAWSNGWQAWSNDSQSAWRNTRSVCFFLIGRGELKKQSACSTGLWLKPVLKNFLTSFAIFELRKGWNLAWYHHFTHITCVQKLRGLRQKLNALRVQTGPSLSKCEGFRRKLNSYKGISFF